MKSTIYRQQDQSDCGVACLLSVIAFYKGSNNLDSLRRLSGTSISGSTLLGLYEAATKVGFDAMGCQATIFDLLAYNQPVIIHVVMPGNLQHYIVCFGQRKNKQGLVEFEIGDPARGILFLSEIELQNIWKSGACLTLKPNAQFVTADKTRKAKGLWLIAILKNDLPILGLATCMGLLMAAMSLSMAVFSQKLIDDFLPGKKAGNIYAGVLLVGLILLIREGLSALRQWLLIQQGRDFNSRIVQYFFSRLLHLPMPFFDSRKIGDLTARLNDTGRIQRVVTQIVGTAIIQVLVVVVSLSFLFRYSATIAVLTLIISPFFFLLAFLYRHQVLTKQSLVMQGNALTEANYISTIQGIGAIKSHNQQSDFAIQNEQVYGSYQGAILQLGKLQIKISLLVNISSNLFLMVLLAYGSSLVLSGQMKAGELMATLSLAGGILPGVAGLALLSIPLSEAMVAIDRMYEFTGLETEDDSEKGTTMPLNIESLEVKNLSFRFPGRGSLLRDINLYFEKGEIIGLIGENGCGKSTLVQLLMKSYQPVSGIISINNLTNIQSISNKVWKKHCSVVPQHVHLFNSTVLGNIAFGDEVKNSSAVLDFLDKNGFTSLFNILPQGVFTLIGDEGINLSGGQRQLVGIARALYARPQFLILDESTSAMDLVTEQFVLNLLDKLIPEMGVLFITHRLHILKQKCHRIYIMKQGTISSVGNHYQLMKSDNLYSKHWEQLLNENESKSILQIFK